MIRKTSILALFLFAVCLVPRMSFAGTVQLTVEPSSGSPYVFQIGTSKTFVDLSCLNDQRRINVGESWTATAENLGLMISDPTHNPTDGTMTLNELKEDAYLVSLYSSNFTSAKNLEIQDAIWTILDRATGKIGNTSYVYTNLNGQTAEETVVQQDYAAAVASLSSTYYNTSSFYSEFTFYAPVQGTYQNDKYGGIPQQFLGYCPVTPEPSSLILLGTGIAGLAGAMRRRFTGSKQA